MTPYSSQSAPVPDRYISRLRHSQSRTRGKRVKDLKLRAIQISCTLFHPLQCMSLPLFSFWMTVSFFPSSYTYLFSLYTLLASLFYPLLSFSIFLFEFLFLVYEFSFHDFLMWDWTVSFTGMLCKCTEGVCEREVARPCVSLSHLTVGYIQNNIHL